MNPAHLHLILNHIPIVAIPVVLAFLIHSLWTKNFAARKFAYFALILAAAAAVPVYLTGEPAEEIVERLPGVSEAFIEAHEEAAVVTLALTALAGLAALFGLLAGEGGLKERLSVVGVFALSVIALASLAYTANLGGKIRHTELRGASSGQVGAEGKAGETAGEQESESD